MISISIGQRINVTTADGRRLAKIAVSGPVDGDDFRIVWVCKPEDWPMDITSVNNYKTMAWPIEAVSPA
jgi:hypothetical protein